MVEWSEGSLHAAIEATARGLPSLPAPTSPGSAVVAGNPHLRVAPDPFTGEDVVVARALPIDVALLHVPEADAAGNLFIAGDGGLDGLLARAATTVVASASRVTDRPASEAAIARIWVDHVVVDPRGAWPTACHPTEAGDWPVVFRWAKAGGEDRCPPHPRGRGGGAVSTDLAGHSLLTSRSRASSSRRGRPGCGCSRSPRRCRWRRGWSRAGPGCPTSRSRRASRCSTRSTRRR